MLNFKPTICFDFDEVLLPLLPSFIKFSNRVTKANNRLEQFNSYIFHKVLDKTQEEVDKLWKQFVESEEFIELHKTEPTEECLKVLNHLHFNRKCKLVIVTARNHSLQKITTNYVSQFFGDLFEEIHFGNHHDPLGEKKTKRQMCNSVGGLMLIDDNPIYIKEVSEDSGMKAILFGNYPWNQSGMNLVDEKSVWHSCGWGELIEVIEKVMQN